jgi:hypothetical protein
VEHKILFLYTSESVVAHIAFILHHKFVVTKTLDDSFLMLGLCFVSGI